MIEKDAPLTVMAYALSIGQCDTVLLKTTVLCIYYGETTKTGNQAYMLYSTRQKIVETY